MMQNAKTRIVAMRKSDLPPHWEVDVENLVLPPTLHTDLNKGIFTRCVQTRRCSTRFREEFLGHAQFRVDVETV